MSNEGAAFIAIIIIPIIGVIAFVLFILWAIYYEMKRSKKMKEEAKNYDVRIEEGDTKRHLVRSLALIGGGWLLNQPWNVQNRIESLAVIGVILWLVGLILLGYWLVSEAENSSRKKKILAAAKSQSESKENFESL